MDVKHRSGDMNSRKAFELRSNYVRITFELRSIAFDLCKYYANIAFKNQKIKGRFWSHLEIIKKYMPESIFERNCLKIQQIGVFSWRPASFQHGIPWPDPWPLQDACGFCKNDRLQLRNLLAWLVGLVAVTSRCQFLGKTLDGCATTYILHDDLIDFMS